MQKNVEPSSHYSNIHKMSFEEELDDLIIKCKSVVLRERNSVEEFENLIRLHKILQDLLLFGVDTDVKVLKKDVLEALTLYRKFFENILFHKTQEERENYKEITIYYRIVELLNNSDIQDYYFFHYAMLIFGDMLNIVEGPKN